MQKESDDCRDYFTPGQRASVELSLQDDRVFRDGAVVTEVEEGQIGLRLSRDRLPEGVALTAETQLSLRVSLNGSGFLCRCLVMDEQPGEELHVTVIGRVKPEDAREFFRLDTDLPVVVFNVTAGTSEETGTGGLRVAGQGALPRIVNISGGGLRLETQMAMSIGDLIYATFHLPLPEPKLLPMVAQVVHSQIIDRPGATCVSSGLSFLHINERDRDAIVSFVCNEEIKKIRLCRKDFLSLQD